MPCPPIQDLHRFHDDELSPVEREAVVSHVQSCDACAQTLASIRSAGDLVRSATPAAPTPQMMQRWRRAGQVITRQALQDRSVRRLAGWMTAAASIVLVVSVYVASSTPAQANSSSTDWEAVALGMEVETASVDVPAHQAAAAWIVTDLGTASPTGSRP